MAARASCTERAIAARRWVTYAARSWRAPAAGIAWGHATLITAAAMPALAHAMPQPGHPSGVWITVFEWTALLPLSVTVALAAGSTEPLAAISRGVPAYALPLPALAGCALATAVAWLARATQTRSAVLTLLTAFLATALFSAATATVSLVRERAAAELFGEAVSAATEPWRVASSRAAARTLVRRYPETTWASEAWRIIAIDAGVRGSQREEEAAWRGFRASFEPHESAGRALASLNLARLALGRPDDVAFGHYLTARRAVNRSGPDVQQWIALRAASELERLALRKGLYATALYWASTPR